MTEDILELVEKSRKFIKIIVKNTKHSIRKSEKNVMKVKRSGSMASPPK